MQRDRNGFLGFGVSVAAAAVVVAVVRGDWVIDEGRLAETMAVAQTCVEDPAADSGHWRCSLLRAQIDSEAAPNYPGAVTAERRIHGRHLQKKHCHLLASSQYQEEGVDAVNVHGHGSEAVSQVPCRQVRKFDLNQESPGLLTNLFGLNMKDRLAAVREAPQMRAVGVIGRASRTLDDCY